MKPAPAFDCARCRRRIGRARTHYATGDGQIVCEQCLDRAAHASLFPGCGTAWHDVLDHLSTIGDRPATAALLGLWP